MGAEIITLDRNPKKAKELHSAIKFRYPECNITGLTVDLEDINSVKKACDMLENRPIHILVHNAGAYSIPRHKTSCGFDNVFQINFVSPYYITKRLLGTLRQNGGRVVVVGSIAHNYSKTDVKDIDFSTRKASNLVYGNSKRYIMFSHYAIAQKEKGVRLSVVHPGITFTNITAHYPNWLFAIIKHPMKIIFMKPKKAALSIIEGLFTDCQKNEWIGPRLFDIWGKPRKRVLRTVKAEEYAHICHTAEDIYLKIAE